MRQLRPALTPGTPVMAFIKGKWIPAHVQKLSPCAGTCEVDVDDAAELNRLARSFGHHQQSYQLPFSQLRRRFWQGQPCRIYRGPTRGWAKCTIAEDFMEEDQSDPGNSQVSMTSVWLDDMDNSSNDPVVVPTYLLKTNNIPFDATVSV